MSISLKSVKCPECGAQLEFEEGRSTMFCNYCGAKIVLTNENEYIYHHIDDAEIKRAETEAIRAETERLIQMKAMETAEEDRKAKEKSKKNSLYISIILAVLGILLMVIGFIFTIKPNLTGLAILGLLLLIVSLIVWIRSRKK